MKFLLLSYPINDETLPYGNNPKPIITPYSEIAKGDSANSFLLKLHNHTGTHVDAPKHFIPEGKSISDYFLEELIFDAPVLVERPKNPKEWVEAGELRENKLRDLNCLLIRTGFGSFRGQEIYRTSNPGVAPEAILYIRKNFPKIRCIGIDSISISCPHDRARGREAHLTAFEAREGLGEPLLLVEDMNLNTLSAGDKLTKVILLPWQISNIDSVPCIVLAVVEGD